MPRLQNKFGPKSTGKFSILIVRYCAAWPKLFGDNGCIFFRRSCFKIVESDYTLARSRIIEIGATGQI